MSTTEIQVHDHLATLSRNATVRSVGHARCQMPPSQEDPARDSDATRSIAAGLQLDNGTRTSLVTGLSLCRVHIRRMSMRCPRADRQNRRECRGHSCG